MEGMGEQQHFGTELVHAKLVLPPLVVVAVVRPELVVGVAIILNIYFMIE
jgi:hypothetical protein